MPSDQPALLDPKKKHRRSRFEAMQDGKIDGGCVSPITPTAAVTYRHGSHGFLKIFREGRSDRFNEPSIVHIRHCYDQTFRHRMKVIVVDDHQDFVILYSIDGSKIFDDFPCLLRNPKEFEWFIGFGLSHESDGSQQVTYRNGRFCSIRPDHRGRFLASCSIDGGDSGGPCYAFDKALVGIMVSTRTYGSVVGNTYSRRQIEDGLSSASSNPADTMITPGYSIMTAYAAYRVKSGLEEARGETNYGERQSRRSRKRRASSRLLFA